MKFTATIDLDNAWFGDPDTGALDPATVAAAIRNVAAMVEAAGPVQAPTGRTVRDGNGNTVGAWAITEEDA